MHRHDQNMGRGRHESGRDRDDERRMGTARGRDDEYEERGDDTRSSEHHARPHDRPHDRQHERWMDADAGRRDEGQRFDEGRRFGGRGFYDRDRDSLSRGGQGGYRGYGGSGERQGEFQGRGMGWRDREEMRRFDRGDDQPQDYGTRSIGFRDRMGEDYGYGGYGHMGQSDMDSDRRMGGAQDRGGMGRGMDRGYGGTDRGYGLERYSDRDAHDRNSGMGMRQGYGGMDRNYDDARRMGDPRMTQGGPYGMDRNERGMGNPSPMRGKGPKNYARSDERIREEVCELLEDADLDASEIEVKVRSGEVTLEGTVSDRWAKREAEDVIVHARGVKDCHNQLKVQSRDMQQQSQGQSQQPQSRGNNGSTAVAQDKQQRTS